MEHKVSKEMMESILKFKSKDNIIVSFKDDEFYLNMDGKNYGPFTTRDKAQKLKQKLQETKSQNLEKIFSITT